MISRKGPGFQLPWMVVESEQIGPKQTPDQPVYFQEEINPTKELKKFI